MCLKDRMSIIKQIKASYDRFGIDMQDDATPESREAKFGKVMIYNFGNGFLGWSPNLCPEHTDFLMTHRTMATAIAAELNAKARLSAETRREYGHGEILFRQRPEVRKVVPPSLIGEKDKYILFLVTRTKQRDLALVEEFYCCLERLRDLLVKLQMFSVSLPIIDA